MVVPAGMTAGIDDSGFVVPVVVRVVVRVVVLLVEHFARTVVPVAVG